MVLLPATWQHWGTFPRTEDKEPWLIGCHWRAFSPKGEIISINWEIEMATGGEYICRRYKSKSSVFPAVSTEAVITFSSTVVSAIRKCIEKWVKEIEEKEAETNLTVSVFSAT